MWQAPLVGSAVTLAPAGSVPAFAEGRTLTPELPHWVPPSGTLLPGACGILRPASHFLMETLSLVTGWGTCFILLFDLLGNLLYICFNHLIAQEKEA